MTSGAAIVGDFQVEAAGVRGYAYDADDLTRRLVVELLVDGWPVDLARAEDFAPEASSIGDGCYGFGFRLPEAFLDEGGAVAVRVANTGEPLGEPALISEKHGGAPSTVPGRVEWSGGLRLTGWVEPAALGASARVRLVVERRTVVEGEARGFAAAKQGALRNMKARFDLRLPEVFADGRVHRVTVLDGEGRELAGSPCAVLGFADGLRNALIQRSGALEGDPRAELIDRILPRSVPFAEVAGWLADHEAGRVARFPRETTVAVLMLGGECEALASLRDQDHASWIAVSVPAADGPGTFDPAACRAALAAEPGVAAVVILPAGARLRPLALQRYAALAEAEGGPVYADASVGTADGDLPLLWPAYDPERQLEQGYAALAFAASAAAVCDALERGASSSFALFDRLAAERPPVHVPEILVELPRPDPRLGRALATASLVRAGGAATLSAPDPRTGLPVVHLRRTRPDGPTAVAVIQPEPFLPDLATAAAALPDIVERVIASHHPFRVPSGWRNIVLPGARNPSRLRDAAVRETEAARCLVLDAGVEPGTGEAVEEMLSRLADGAVAVGGLVLDDEGILLSAGVVLGPNFGPAQAFAGLAPDTDAYAGSLSVARSCGALDPAALLVDRRVAISVGSFDPLLFPEHFGSVDLCLRLRAGGGRLVVTPRARFVRRRAWRPGRSGEGAKAELAALRRRWARDLADDPFYHPDLNHDGAPFTGLAWPPRPRNPRRPDAPLSFLDPELRR